MKAVLCSTCQGSGYRYPFPVWDKTSASESYYVCSGCGGRGWVEVEYEEYLDDELDAAKSEREPD